MVVLVVMVLMVVVIIAMLPWAQMTPPSRSHRYFKSTAQEWTLVSQSLSSVFSSTLLKGVLVKWLWLMVIDYLIELELDTMVMWLCVCGFEGPFFLAATPGRVVLIFVLVVLVE